MKRKLLFALTAVAVLVPSAAYGHHVFDDVDDTRFFAEPVDWAFANGITTGKTDTLFAPDDPVTRGEAVTFLKRYHDNIAAHLDTDTDTDTNDDTLAELSCSDGATVHDDGDWTCGATGVSAEIAGAFTTPIHVSGGDQVFDPAIAIGHDGNAVIVFQNRSGGDSDLGIVVCHDPECRTHSRRTVSTSDQDGGEPSLAIGHDGNPIIAHENENHAALAFYVCSDPLCSDGDEHLYPASGSDEYGRFSAIAIRDDGRPIAVHRAYDDSANNNDLAIFACSNPSCSSGSNRVISTTDGDGADMSIVIGEDGNPIIAFQNQNDDDLVVYACSTSNCSAGDYHQVETADEDGWDSSITINSTGNPIISYVNPEDSSNLATYACSSPDCSSGENTVHEDDAFGGQNSTVVVPPGGFPVIAFDSAHDISVFACANPNCSSGTRHVIYTDANDELASMALSPTGALLVAHVTGADDDLYVTTVRVHQTGIEVVAP